MPVNVQLSDGNFSFGPNPGFFYSISRSLNALVEVEADGTVVNTFPLTGSLIRGDILELHYDGTFFWSLEPLPSNLGLVIKKWRLFPFKTFAFPGVTPTELRWQDELTLISNNSIRWSGRAFAVQHYHRVLDGSFLRGSTSIVLDSVEHINPGDVLYLGPSTFGGFVGNEESVVVSTVNSTTRVVTFSKPGGLENSYISNDPVDFHKSVFVFNDHGFSGREDEAGILVEFEWPSKIQIRSDSGRKYGGVSAADFDQEILSWARHLQILQLDIFNPTFDLQASLEANMLEADLATVIEMFDLIADLDNSLYYKLQLKETTEDTATGVFTTTSFPNGKYNFQTQTTIPEVNSTALSFPVTRITSPLPAGDAFPVVAQVRDQFNFPVSGKTVQFSAAINALSDPGLPGTFSPVNVVTNVSGIAETVYTPSSTPTSILVDLQAKVL